LLWLSEELTIRLIFTQVGAWFLQSQLDGYL